MVVSDHPERYRAAWRTRKLGRMAEVLRQHPEGLTARELALYLGLDHANVAREAPELERRGLCRRVRIKPKFPAGAPPYLMFPTNPKGPTDE